MKVNKRLLELDCLRGIAVMLVVIFHFTLAQEFLHNFFNFGFIGVDLFFMISGFVIFLTIEKTTNYKTFLISRFARLYPAYWVCVSITTLMIILWSATAKVPMIFGFKDYLANLTMLQYYFGIDNIDGAYWSLLIELLFYAFIVIIYLIKKQSRIEFISFFVVLLCMVYGAVLKTLAPGIYIFISNWLPIVYYFPLFIAGIVFYKIKFYKITVYRILLVLFCLVTEIVLFNSTGKTIMISQLEYAAILPLFFILFFLYCFNYLGFIINRVTLFLGKISYSLYLIHNFMSAAILIPLLTHSRYFHLNISVALLIVAPIVLITATLINKYVEVPATKYFKRKWAVNAQLNKVAG